MACGLRSPAFLSFSKIKHLIDLSNQPPKSEDLGGFFKMRPKTLFKPFKGWGETVPKFEQQVFLSGC